METAYLYVRVSTDEQKRKGYSLAEQEERLLRHCEFNNIKIKDIVREDYSAKDFNRPEWKSLINKIKRNRHRQPENILFLKWDRFSRSVQYAYQMLGILRGLNVAAMAIDQPIDFDVPESIVMLAVYLSIPEAENHRRGLNTSDGMMRAKKMGRWPGKAPIGYVNLTALDGKKFIAPKQPEANHIKWSFQQLAKGRLTINQVWKMACANGFRCSKSNFWKLVRNPVYCGMVTIPACKDEGPRFIKGIHQPLITESLFHEVQELLNSRRKIVCKKEDLITSFPLRGFLTCPLCQGRITGSFSQGKRSKFGYYHCTRPRCRGRFRVEALNESYEKELKKMRLIPQVYELFGLVLEDENIYTNRRIQIDDRKAVLDRITKQQALMSRARNFYLNEKIDFEDFGRLKEEHNEISGYLDSQLRTITTKLLRGYMNTNAWPGGNLNILQAYKNMDIEEKRRIISLFSPSGIDPHTKTLAPLNFSKALSLIVDYCDAEGG
ncbi:recombinase family protein [Pedobacter sp. ASV28]|uniref:recombinase family protein n=1 Tax=Pedobacter sp. ASV28 TaxID=2795123 RepID=UPI0018EAB571|nr:recombinase family protein [Pedobacter sp. ASV28]